MNCLLVLMSHRVVLESTVITPSVEQNAAGAWTYDVAVIARFRGGKAVFSCTEARAEPAHE
jgi:hypothetical protein